MIERHWSVSVNEELRLVGAPHVGALVLAGRACLYDISALGAYISSPDFRRGMLAAGLCQVLTRRRTGYCLQRETAPGMHSKVRAFEREMPAVILSRRHSFSAGDPPGDGVPPGCRSRR